MTNYLDRALQYIGADRGDVLAHARAGNEYVIVLDLGIKGCPKYRVPLSDLPELEPEPKPEPEPEAEPEPEPAVYVCDHCGREFDSARGLAIHLNYCDAIEEEE